MDERSVQLTDQYNANQETYGAKYDELQVRLHNLRNRMKVLSETWEMTGPHGEQQEVQCKELVQTVTKSALEWSQIEAAREQYLIPLLKTVSKMRHSRPSARIPVLEELLQSSLRDLEIGIPRRSEILDRYERAVSDVEEFYRSENIITD